MNSKLLFLFCLTPPGLVVLAWIRGIIGNGETPSPVPIQCDKPITLGTGLKQAADTCDGSQNSVCTYHCLATDGYVAATYISDTCTTTGPYQFTSTNSLPSSCTTDVFCLPPTPTAGMIQTEGTCSGKYDTQCIYTCDANYISKTMISLPCTTSGAYQFTSLPFCTEIPKARGQPPISDCLGVYNILGNGTAGTLNLSQTVNGMYEGTLQYDTAILPGGNPGSIEHLSDIKWVNDYNATFLYFQRPSTGEIYEGVCHSGEVSNDAKNPRSKTIHGFFWSENSDAGLTWQFDAQQDISVNPITDLSDEHYGTFALLANGTAGILFLNKDGTGSARFENDTLEYGIPLPTEEITQIKYVKKYNGWYLLFYRPSVDYQYYGIYSYGASSNQIAGGFFHGSSDYLFWPLDGSKRKVTDAPTIPYDVHYASNTHGYIGESAFYNSTPNTLVYYGSCTQLPINNPGCQGTLTDISWSLRLNNGFYYVYYTRGYNWQWYFSLWDDKRHSYEGHFRDVNYPGSWPVDGCSNNFLS